jgi:hypothetical protein
MIRVGDEINIGDTVGQYREPDLVFQLHVGIIDRNVIGIPEVLVNIDVSAHLPDDLEIHLTVVVSVDIRVGDPLGLEGRCPHQKHRVKDGCPHGSDLNDKSTH